MAAFKLELGFDQVQVWAPWEFLRLLGQPGERRIGYVTVTMPPSGFGNCSV